MDANKAKRLREIGYRIGGTCDSCADFDAKPGQMFGTCKLWTYKHEKHTGDERQLSVSSQGGCPNWSQSEVSLYIHSSFVF